MLHDDAECWNEIAEWIAAAKVADIMQYNRLGCMGHYYSGMLEHEQELKKLSAQYNKPLNYYKQIIYDHNIINANGLAAYNSYEEAYHHLIKNIIEQQVLSTNLVLRGTTCKIIFVDGGFSNNAVYMNLLAKAFPGIDAYAATVPQATALGAALVIHEAWNTKSLPVNTINLKYYSAKQQKHN